MASGCTDLCETDIDLPESVRKCHYQLYNQLSDHIFPGHRVWEKFLTLLRTNLTEKDVHTFRKKQCSVICRTLEEKGKIRVGDYKLLIELFEILECGQVVNIIKTEEIKIQKELQKTSEWYNMQ